MHRVTCGTLRAWPSGDLADYARVSFSEGGGCCEVQGSPESLTEVMEQLAAVFPSIVRPMITERDEYMAVRLRMLAPKCGPLQRLQGCM